MKLKITTLLLALTGLFIMPASSQEITGDTLSRTVEGIQQTLEVMKRIKISGYIQAQYQVADSAGAKSYAGGDFASGVDKRFQLRRGRVKFVYDSPLNEKGWSTSQYVFQFDVSQSGVGIKDAYAKFTDPWTGWFSITAGMQNRPFGFEIVYSSGLRESPERGRMSQIVFPNERDLGAMLSIQGPKSSNWNWLKFDIGYFNGTGAPSAGSNTSDFDKFKDLIGHIGISKSTKSETIKWGLGASFYEGGFRQDTSNRYVMGLDSLGVKSFAIDLKKADVSPFINNRGEAKRSYVGGDGQISIDWTPGLTTVRAEYIQGDQPGIAGSSTSPSTVVTADVYVRKFNGAYFYFIQNILRSPLQAIVKYDWYDPNTDVSKNEIGKSVTTGYKATGPADLKVSTLGVGLAYRWDAAVKLTAYYDMVTNETSTNLTGSNAIYQHDLEDNVFTLRVQVKF